jgi:hypothetical protein
VPYTELRTHRSRKSTFRRPISEEYSLLRRREHRLANTQVRESTATVPVDGRLHAGLCRIAKFPESFVICGANAFDD